MFNPADFDALTVALEEQFLEGPADGNSGEYVAQRRAIATVRRLAESFGLMAPEPAPVRLCQECGAAPTVNQYSRLCDTCYAIALEEIRAELAQDGPDFDVDFAEDAGRWLGSPAIVDASDDAPEIVV